MEYNPPIVRFAGAAHPQENTRKGVRLMKAKKSQKKAPLTDLSIFDDDTRKRFETALNELDAELKFLEACLEESERLTENDFEIIFHD